MFGYGSDIPTGTEFSHYRIVSKIEAGGMGSVYLADDLSLGRRVAIKFLNAATDADPAARERLLQEARVTAQVTHPATAAVYEISVYQDRPAIVMEFVEGKPLHRLIQCGPLPVSTVIDITHQLCEALAAIHSRGLVHGDIKPANLVLEPGGRLRILDFGIAHIIEQGNLGPGITSGTAGYSAPEVLTGETSDARSDLFSVGVVLYELLTGTRPFTGAYDAAIAYSIVNEQPASLSSQLPGVPPALEKVIFRLLEKKPEQRYQSAQDILPDLANTYDRPASETSRRTSWYGLAAAAGLLVVASAWYALRDGAPEVPENPVLAVLPFENLGPAGEEYFADGVTDEIAGCIAGNSRLSVISRNSSMLYKDAAKSTHQIGRELGADYVVHGTIHWERSPGNRVRINARLIRVEDDVTRWSESYDGDLSGIFDMQQKVAQAVSSALNVAMAQQPGGLTRTSPTKNLAAYDLFLQGNEYFHRSWDRNDIEIAGTLYRKAVAIDSTFAAAWAMLSRAEASMYWEYFDHSETRCEAAYAAARRALALWQDLPQGYEALGYCYYHCDRDYEQAVAQWKRGLAVDPNNSELENAIAAVYRRQGELEKAAAGFIRALELDPRSHLKAFDIALTYGMMRRFTESDQYLRRTVELAPDYALAHIYRAWLPILQSGDTAKTRQVLAEASKVADLTQSKYYWWLLRLIEAPDRHQSIAMTPATDTVAYLLFRAQAFRLVGDHDGERQYADSARILLELRMSGQPGDSRYLSELGMAWAGLGDKGKALASATSAVELLPTSREAFDAPFYLLNLAEILVIFGEYDAAVEQIKTLLSIPGFASAAYLKLDPLWQPLRKHPEFQRLLTGTGQSAS